MQIAHPSYDEKILSGLKAQLEIETETIYKELEVLELKQKFLAATNIYNTLKHNFDEKKIIFSIDYMYDNSQAKCFFEGVKIHDVENKIQIKGINKTNLISDTMYFLDNIKENLMKPETQNISFFNDSDGRFSLLKSIMGEDYQLWQSMVLEQNLPDNKQKRKKPKI